MTFEERTKLAKEQLLKQPLITLEMAKAQVAFLNTNAKAGQKKSIKPQTDDNK